MRLKLFFTPQLCLSLAVLAQPRLFFGSQKILPHIPSSYPKRKRLSGPHHNNYTAWTPSWKKLVLLNAAFVGAIALAAHNGISNLRVSFIFSIYATIIIYLLIYFDSTHYVIRSNGCIAMNARIQFRGFSL